MDARRRRFTGQRRLKKVKPVRRYVHGTVTETKQTTAGGLAYTLSGLLLFAILCSLWTYIAWLSNSSILDFCPTSPILDPSR